MLPTNPKVLLVGDSWGFGQYATEREHGFAHYAFEQLGWSETVNASIGGTGYIDPGAADTGGNYLQRVVKMDDLEFGDPDLVILQGSINDTDQVFQALPVALTDIKAVINAKWPDAQILVLGPFSPLASPGQVLSAVDGSLKNTSARLGIAFMSPIRLNWTDISNVDTVVDKANGHPDDAGYEYYGTKFREELQTIMDVR